MHCGSSSARVASVVSAVTSNGTAVSATALSKSSLAGGAATAGDAATRTAPTVRVIPSSVLRHPVLIASLLLSSPSLELALHDVGVAQPVVAPGRDHAGVPSGRIGGDRDVVTHVRGVDHEVLPPGDGREAGLGRPHVLPRRTAVGGTRHERVNHEVPL